MPRGEIPSYCKGAELDDICEHSLALAMLAYMLFHLV